jgi:hypothetical protein
MCTMGQGDRRTYWNSLWLVPDWITFFWQKAVLWMPVLSSRVTVLILMGNIQPCIYMFVLSPIVTAKNWWKIIAKNIVMLLFFNGVDMYDFYGCFHLPIGVSISTLLNIWKDFFYFLIGRNITLHEGMNKVDFLVSKCLLCTYSVYVLFWVQDIVRLLVNVIDCKNNVQNNKNTFKEETWRTRCITRTDFRQWLCHAFARRQHFTVVKVTENKTL